MKKGKTALITGASYGIGREFCQLFAQQGYDLVIVARTENKLTDLATSLITQYQIQVTVICQDLSEENAATYIFAQCQQQHLHIDVLVNNAGFGLSGLFSEQALAEIINMIALNIRALTCLTHLFLPSMLLKNEGKILNVASTAAFQAGPYMSVYFATKAFVLSFSEALSAELRNKNITVTALCPGYTETEFSKRAKLLTSKLALRKFNNMSASEVAHIGYNALQKNKRLAIAGKLNWWIVFMTRFAPRRLTAAIAEYLVRNV